MMPNMHKDTYDHEENSNTCIHRIINLKKRIDISIMFLNFK